MQLTYPARLRRDDDGRYLVTLVSFPNASTDGTDLREATEEAIDLLGSVLADLMIAKAEIPAPSPTKRGERSIPVPMWLAGKLALYQELRAQGVSNSQLARRMQIGETAVRRMTNPHHHTRLETLQTALEALGKRVVVGLEDAA